jgi:hypothetical protein
MVLEVLKIAFARATFARPYCLAAAESHALGSLCPATRVMRGAAPGLPREGPAANAPRPQLGPHAYAVSASPVRAAGLKSFVGCACVQFFGLRRQTLKASPLPVMVRAMSDREHEQLDIDEMERRVASALIALVDDPHEQHRITPKLLAARSRLPVRRVREITEAWNLQTLSGDEYWFGPGTIQHARARAHELSQAPSLL